MYLMASEKEVLKRVSEDDGQKNLLKMSEISVWIDHYDDIFSDFDSRPYSERALSQDFLEEMKRASRDKPTGDLSLNFLMPMEQRTVVNETLVRKRLRDHFRHHAEELRMEHRKIKRTGVTFISSGIVMLALAAYLPYFHLNDFLYNLFTIILEPGGWFFFWEGLDKFLIESKRQLPRYNFYKRMSKLEIYFTDY